MAEEDARAFGVAVAKLFLKSERPEEQGAGGNRASAAKERTAQPDQDDATAAAGEEDETAAPDGTRKQPVVFGQQETEAIVALIPLVKRAGIAPDEMRPLLEKPTQRRKAPQDVQDAIAAIATLPSHAGPDAVLFGRMATGCITRNIDGCVEVAHAPTIHPIQSIADFFSVQDTLKTEDEHRGGAHINTAELASGLFYARAVLDTRRLATLTPTLSDADRAELAAWLVRTFAQVDPAAKWGSTAPTGRLRELIVEIGRRLPVSYVAAFEVAIQPRAGTSTAKEAKERLDDYMVEVDGDLGAPMHRFRLAEWRGKEVPAVEALAAALRERLLQGAATAGAAE